MASLQACTLGGLTMSSRSRSLPVVVIRGIAAFPATVAQSFQKSLMEEYALNHAGILNMIQGTFLI